MKLQDRLALRFEALGLPSRRARVLAAVAALELRAELAELSRAAAGWAAEERALAETGVTLFPGAAARRVADLLDERAQDEPRCVFCRSRAPDRGVACQECAAGHGVK